MTTEIPSNYERPGGSLSCWGRWLFWGVAFLSGFLLAHAVAGCGGGGQAVSDAELARAEEVARAKLPSPMPAGAVTFTYQSWKDEIRRRWVLPERDSLRHEANQHHPVKTWLFDAVDLETGLRRAFALDKIRGTIQSCGGKK